MKKTKAKLQAQNEEAEKTLNELADKISEATKTLDDIAQDVERYRELADDEKKIIDKQLSQAKKEYDDFMENEMRLVGCYHSLEEVGLEYTNKLESLDEIENRLITVEQKIGDMVKSGNCLSTTKEYRIDGSGAKGRTFQSNYGKNLIIGLNAVYNKMAKSNTIDLYSAKAKISKAYEKYNKQARLLGIAITNEYSKLLLEAIELKYRLRDLKKEEKERIRKEKQKLKEQEKMLAEAEKERKRLEEERKAMDSAFNTALTEEERESIKQQIVDIDKRIADVDYRCTHYQCGFLYVIASPALPNMYKVGVTRRMPWIRCKELSSSSLPWEFELKAYCFNDDVFELENKMHKYLDGDRVNKDREFFYGEPRTAIEALKNVFNQEVKYGTYQEEGEEMNG